MKDDPFDWGTPSPPRRKPAHGQRKKPAPSGAHQLAALDAFGDPEVTGKFLGRPKRHTKSDGGHPDRIKTFLESNGWVVWQCEFRESSPDRSWKVDFLGIADLYAISTNGKHVLIQVTTEDQVQTHLRKWFDPKTRTSKFGSTRDNFTKWVGAGGGIIIFGMEKVSNRWTWKEHVVGLSDMAKTDSRRRA